MLEKIKSFLFKNTSTRQTVAKNTIWLSISNFGGRMIKAIIVIYGARVLGTAEWGVFSYAVTLAGFFTLFIDPGINAMVMRDVPRSDDEHRLRIFSTTFFMKLAFIATAALVVLFIAPFFSTLPGAKILLPLVALIISFDTLREFLSSFLRAQEKMEWEAGIFIFTNAAIVAAGILFLAFSKTAYAFGWAYVAGTVLGAVAATVILRKNLRTVFSYFSPKLIKPIMTSAWPFAVMGIFGLLLTNTDILIISWMRSASDVGIYSAGIRIIQLLYLFPMIFQYSTLPLLSRLADKDNVRFREAFEQIIGIVFLVSIPMALGGLILGTQFMGLIFGSAYLSGGLAFKLLMLSLVVDYPAMIISTAIFVYHRQKNLVITSAIGGIANVVFDLLLIPRFGIAGSALATLAAQIITNWVLWHMMKKINYFEVFPHLKKIAVASIAMAAVTGFLFLFGANVVVNVLISVGTYFLLLYLLREPLLIEIKRVLPRQQPPVAPEML